MSDEEIEKISRKYVKSMGGHWCNEDGIPQNLIVDFARDLLHVYITTDILKNLVLNERG